MKKRDVAISIVLTIITFGIYGLYWQAVLNDDIKKLAKEEQFTSGGIVVLLSLVTCGIYSIYWAYKMGEFIDKINDKDKNSNILYLILDLIGLEIVVLAIGQSEINKKIEV